MCGGNKHLLTLLSEFFSRIFHTQFYNALMEVAFKTRVREQSILFRKEDFPRNNFMYPCNNIGILYYIHYIKNKPKVDSTNLRC